MAKSSKVSAVFTSDPSGLEFGIKRAQKALRELRGDAQGLSSSMGGLNKAVNLSNFVALGSIAARAIGSFSRQVGFAIGQATDLSEEMSKSTQLFGGAADEVQRFADSASDLGFTKVQALEAANTFGNLFKALGYGAEVAADMSLTMTQLSADLASFNNTSVDQATQAMGAALRGEFEPLRRYGILLDQATIKQKAYELGLISSVNQGMTPAIRAQATYAAIMEQSEQAQGDFIRTAGGLANLGRVVTAKLGNIAASIGAMFEPILVEVGAAVVDILRPVEEIFATVRDSVVGAWEAAGPVIADFFWDTVEILARGVDAIVATFAGVWGVAADVLNFFASLLPEWSVSINWFGVAAEVLQRGVLMFEGVAKGFAAGWGYVISSLYEVVEWSLRGMAKVAEMMGLSGEALREWADTVDREGRFVWDAADQLWSDAGADFAGAFGDEFEPSDLGRIMFEGFEGGAEDMVEGWRRESEERAERLRKAGEAAGSSMYTGVVEGADKAAKFLATERAGVDAVVRMINRTGNTVADRQLAAMERTADATEEIAEEEGVEVVEIA